MSKPKQYANIPVGYVCIPVEEYFDIRYGRKNMIAANDKLQNEIYELNEQIESLREQLNDAEAERDSNKNSLLFWVDRAKGFETEIEKLKAENAKLRDTVSFYVPKWEEDEEQCRT